MYKEKRILSYFLGWLIVGFIIMFVGINNIYALDYNNIGYIDNYTDVLIDVTYETESNSLLTVQKTQEVYTEIKVLYIDVSNYNFNANTHYQLELSLPNMTLNNANYYEVYDSNNNNCTISNEYSTFNTAYPKWDFECKNNTNAITIKVGNRNNTAITNTGTFRWNYTYLRYTNTPIENTNQQIADNIINNQNQNTQDIINNNNQNTQDIIDSNKETQEVIENQFNNCFNSTIEININNKNNFNTIGYIDNNNIIQVHNDYRVSNYIGIKSNSSYNIIQKITSNDTNYNANWNLCWYDENKEIISCERQTTGNYISPNYAKYVRINGYVISNRNTSISGIICSNKIDDTNDKLGDLNSSLNDSNSSGATNDASNFFSNFTTDTFGLTSIITAPLSLINTLTNSSCSSLRLPLPYLDNKYLELPCMNTIYTRYFGSFFNIYQTITFGIVAYWVIVRIFNQVKDFKNPDHDEIEVLDL